MKKYFIYAAAALALASCANDDYLGVNDSQQYVGNGEISFGSNLPNMTRAQVGKDAAITLGGNFIVEGFKGSESSTSPSSTPVFDNYLVVWGAGTAGTTDDNTNDWKYVGVDHSDRITSAILNGDDFGRSVKNQTIKYWDYSTDQYDFIAYSTGTLNMIATGDAVANTSVKVTKIANAWGSPMFSFTAAKADDFAQCYFTDVTPVKNANYGNTVNLVFKNLSAKVRVGLYETVPGYSVKDVEFYADNTVATPAQYTQKAGLTTGDDISAMGLYENNAGSYVQTSDNTVQDGKTYYTQTPAVSDPTAGNDATFFQPTGSTFAEAGTITVSYPLVGSDNASKNGYNKADVSVAPVTGTSTTTTKTFGALDYKAAKDLAEDNNVKYLGRTLATATMAGTEADNYFKYVIPASTGTALTLRCNYTLVATDGSGETIKVWGANAVVPANYCEWQPNYAYTYIFKISDNTNGSTQKLGGTEGLFPITFDAVVASVIDASAEQTTVTTVATPSVTTYQYGHKQSEEYKAGDIYVQVMKDANLETLTSKATLYTVTDNTATEADVINALQMGTDASGTITGRNGLVLTPSTETMALNVTTIPAVDGTDITVTSGTTGKFTAVASKNYVFVYDYTVSTPAASVIYSYDSAASTTAPSDWSTTYTSYYTKTATVAADGTVNYTYTQAPATWVAGEYYKKYENNNRSYAVKVIKTGTNYTN